MTVEMVYTLDFNHPPPVASIEQEDKDDGAFLHQRWKLVCIG